MKLMASKYGEKSFYIITNQTKNEAEGKMIFNALLNASDQFLDSVQLWHLQNFIFDEKVRQSVARQQPVLKLEKEGSIVKSYRELADKVVAMELKNQKGGMQFLLKQALGARSA
jgi:MinD-like ATPase involved in chromosome partitioning or flagellar assembly